MKKLNSINSILIIALFGIIVIGTTACSTSGEDINNANSDHSHGSYNGSNSDENVAFPDIHGIGYSSDGQRIIVPAHDGLKIFSKGAWTVGQGDKHDYMGFTAVSNGFYSSGHPEKGSDERNPFGIVKSTNEGITLKKLALYGEVDFHLMSVSYNTHTIYVMNPHSNSAMKEKGMYYSKDDALTWTRSAMNGFKDEPVSLAVHPNQDAIVAIGTDKGLYVSRDYGEHFEKTYDSQVTSISFDIKGDLYVGGYDQGRATLTHIDIKSVAQTEVEIPVILEDVVIYLAVNPTDDEELVFATYNKDIYLSQNSGENWTKIAEKGIGIPKK